jgi:hypothetical protein
MNLRHAAALALVGWYLMVPPYNENVFRCDLNAPLTEWRHHSGAVIAQADSTNSMGETSEQEQARLKAEEDKVKAVMTRYKARLTLPHVAQVTVAYEPSINSDVVAIIADRAENVSELEREEPSTLDGYSVIVYPPFIGIK